MANKKEEVEARRGKPRAGRGRPRARRGRPPGKRAVGSPMEGIRAFLERQREQRPEFFAHMANSRIEFLRAIRSLIDWRITVLEGRRDRGTRRRGARIQVTD